MASILGMVKLLKGQDLEALLVALLVALLADLLVDLADLVDHTRDPMAQVDRGGPPSDASGAYQCGFAHLVSLLKPFP